MRSRYGYGALDGCIGNGTIWLVYRITWYSVTTDIAIPRTTTVLLPYRYVIQNDVLAHTWDVTSDTVAAWAAGNLSLDLHLLKSVDGIFINGVLRKLVTTPVESDVIDPFFIPFVLKNRIKTTILNGSQPIASRNS